MRKYVMLLATILSMVSGNPNVAYAQTDVVTVTVRFFADEIVQIPREVMQLKPIAKARIIVIDNFTGNILVTGLTNAEGKWSPTITVKKDPRFSRMATPDYTNLGTVTVMAVAKGYNEKVLFEVPVDPREGQGIHMERISKTLRNEPSYELGWLPRFAMLQMVDHYANELKLTKQQKNGPWGP